ncbi:hypothetical protein SNOG_05187 [Parastagonospora nodorum SN15]|uniref:Rhodopsin domain-containing protein n=1 Tax=Phaeosphaeria nodorum (strain SN15 / ATCC MYA-4574 / FGSC 10173) TaxID=321614 RepID=Q0USS7_PHANO|nr:hypothetical protein SNOG_05187 [Parastagonospora nodorum SN15]EAT87578.1 hypothetical protein SNOG_05187 [Parastagonospora nodorum SN15]
MVLTLANWAFLQFSNIFYSRSLSKLLLAGGGMTVIMDIVIIVLPIREIMRSRFSPKKRLEITPIFVVDIM